MLKKMIDIELGSWKVTIHSLVFRKTYEFEYVNTTKKKILEAILVGLFPKSELEGAIFTELTATRIAELEAEYEKIWDMF